MEIFKRIDSYYSVSNYGRVRSSRSGKILKTHSDSKHKGYAYVNLCYNGVKKTKQVHRLVAMLFLPNPSNLPCVNHKDENPSNNCVDNLEWCDQKYNSNYGTSKGRIASKLKNGLLSKPVQQYRTDGIFVSKWCTYGYNLSYGSKTTRELETKRQTATVNSPKVVAQCSPSGETVIAVYNSISEAAKTTGIDKTSIAKCCNKAIRTDSKGNKHHYRTAGGFVWEFLTPENSEKV